MSDSHDIAPQITEANEKAPTPVQNTNHVPGEHINPDQNQDVEIGKKKKLKKKRMENRHGCLRCLCCACCLPVWATAIVWFILISIIIVVIVIGAVAGTFVLPTVGMNGVVPTNGSQFSFSGYEFKINFGLLVSVNNPNLLSIGLSDVTATAYYPRIGGGRTQIGGGYLAYQEVPKYSDFNFTFPFAIEYDPNKDYDQTVLNDIAEKCGLTGAEKQPINLFYDIKLTAQVLFIKVHPTISSSTTFDCPLNNGSLDGFGEDTSSETVNTT